MGVGYLVWRYAPISPRPRGPLVLPPPSRVVRRGSGGGHVACVCGGGWCLVCSAVAESAARSTPWVPRPHEAGASGTPPWCHRRNHPPGPPVSRVPSGEVHALDTGPPARAGGGGRWPPWGATYPRGGGAMPDGEARVRLAAVLGVLDDVMGDWAWFLEHPDYLEEVLSFCVEVGTGRVVE